MSGAVTRFLLNDRPVESVLAPGTRVLDFLRRESRLRGTKEGCREGECGACTVLVGRRGQAGAMRYSAAASCLLPLAQVAGAHVLTVEGLGTGLTPVQKAICDHHAVQCGYCTPGIVMALTGFFCSSPGLSEQDALDALDGNICRCTGYAPILRAASALSQAFRRRVEPGRDRCEQLVEWGILPQSCLDAPQQLAGLPSRPRSAEAQLIVGGATDLLVQQGEVVEKAAALRLSSALSKAHGIRVSRGELVLGAAVTVEELRTSPVVGAALPDLGRALAEDLKLVASTPLRNQATIAGNLVNASPIGDLSILLLALGATLTVARGASRRVVPLRRFFLDYRKVDLVPGEAVESVSVPIRGLRCHFEKVSRRRILDIASVNTAVCADDEGVSLAAGGVAPVPLYLEAASRALSRNGPGPRSSAPGSAPEVRDLLAAIDLALAAARPISDARGSAAYKRLLLRNLLIASFAALFPQSVDAAALLEAHA